MGVQWFAKKSSSEDVSTRIKRANIADGYNADYLLIPNDSMAVSQIATKSILAGEGSGMTVLSMHTIL